MNYMNNKLYEAMYHNTQKTKYWEIKIHKCYKATKVQADSNNKHCPGKEKEAMLATQWFGL